MEISWNGSGVQLITVLFDYSKNERVLKSIDKGIKIKNLYFVIAI